jgi:hypothetical protein
MGNDTQPPKPLHPKVVASTSGAGVASAATIIVVWAFKQFWHIEIDAGTQLAISTVLAALGALVAGWAWPSGSAQ